MDTFHSQSFFSIFWYFTYYLGKITDCKNKASLSRHIQNRYTGRLTKK